MKELNKSLKVKIGINNLFSALLIMSSPFNCLAENIDLESKISIKNCNIDLLFHLKNNKNETIKIYHSNLPWGLRDSIRIQGIVDNKKMNFLEKNYYPSDPTTEVINIKSREIIDGSVNLKSQFKELIESLSENGIFLIYRYDFIYLGSDEVVTFRGFHFIPKIENTASSNQECK